MLERALSPQLGLETSEFLAKALYSDYTPARNFALGAAWFVVAGTGVGAATDLVPLFSRLNSLRYFTKSELEALEAARNLPGLEKGLETLDVLTRSLLRRGYSPQEVFQLMKNLRGNNSKIIKLLHDILKNAKR